MCARNICQFPVDGTCVVAVLNSRCDNYNDPVTRPRAICDVSLRGSTMMSPFCIACAKSKQLASEVGLGTGFSGRATHA